MIVQRALNLSEVKKDTYIISTSASLLLQIERYLLSPSTLRSHSINIHYHFKCCEYSHYRPSHHSSPHGA
jgi:hypothetical protein